MLLGALISLKIIKPAKLYADRIMRAIIIEDERNSITVLKSLLEQYCSDLIVVAEAMSAAEAILLIAEHKPDLIFLDIQLPDIDGFQMLEQIGRHNDTGSGYPFDIIFVSAYEQYAIQAVRASALDYLVKPVKPAELIRAVAKAMTHTDRKQYQAQVLNLLTDLHKSRTDQRIALPTLGQILFVRPDQIVRVEAHRNYIHVFFASGAKTVISMALYEIEPTLLYHNFIRTHQSHLVNRLYVSMLVRKDNVNELKMTDSTLVPISRQRLEAVKAFLQAVTP